MAMTKLSVNLNKVALLRNARSIGIPDLVRKVRSGDVPANEENNEKRKKTRHEVRDAPPHCGERIGRNNGIGRHVLHSLLRNSTPARGPELVIGNGDVDYPCNAIALTSKISEFFFIFAIALGVGSLSVAIWAMAAFAPPRTMFSIS